MLIGQTTTTDVSLNLPDSGGEAFVWLIIAAVIIGRYVVIKRTRAKAYQAYWARRRADEQRRRDDPDMRDPGA